MGKATENGKISIKIAKSEQNISPQQGWIRVHLTDMGYIDIPPSMEVQSGKYKEYKNEFFEKIFEMEGGKLVIQQKGLNEKLEGAFERYARIVIDTEVGNKGDFDMKQLNSDEITKIGDLIKNSYIEEVNNSGIASIIDASSVKFEKISNIDCFYFQCTRQTNITDEEVIKRAEKYLSQSKSKLIEKKPPVKVYYYEFMNNDRRHFLTMSYRTEEKDTCHLDYEKVLKNLKITKR